MKKKIYGLLSFLLPMLILLTKFLLDKNAKSANAILVSDMLSQYSVLFTYLKDIYKGTSSIFYTHYLGIGGSFYGAFAYYLSSPLNIIILFFKKGEITSFIKILLFLKIGLSSLFMYFYLNHKKVSKSSMFFACSYGLSSYIINYFFNIMWLDSVYFLPLILLGIDFMIEQKKPILYFISLFLCILSNFYTAYMVCIFSVIYFIYQSYIHKKWNKKIIFTFFFSSLLAGCSTFFLSLPVFLESLNFSRPIDNFRVVSILDKILYFFRDFYLGTHTCHELANETGTFLYTGILSFYLMVLYFINKKIDKKEKRASLILILFLFLSCILTTMQYIWHAFSPVNSFFNRFSFVLCFTYLMLAYSEYSNFHKVSLKVNVIILFCYIVIGFILLNTIPFTIESYLLSILFLILYMVLMHSKIYKLVFIFVILELTLHVNISFLFNKDIAMSLEDVSNTLCESVNELDKNYRISKVYNFSGLDSLLCSYSSPNAYSSSISKSSYETFYKNGYSTTSIIYLDELGNTEIMDSLMGVKYQYNTFDKEKEKHKKLDKSFSITSYDTKGKLYSTSTHTLYENENALNIGYIVDSTDIKFDGYMLKYQNELLKVLSGSKKDSLVKLDVKRKDDTFEIDTKGYQNIYYRIYYGMKDSYYMEDIYEVYVDNKKQDGKNFSISYFNNYEEKDKLTLEIKNATYPILDIEVYALDYDVYLDEINVLKKKEVKNVVISKNKYEMDIDKKGKLLLTLPYLDGYKIKINGKNVSYKKALDYFVLLDVDGKSHISISYIPKCFYIGVIISIISVLTFITFTKKCKK